MIFIVVFLRQVGVFCLVRVASFSLALLLIKRRKSLYPVEYRIKAILSSYFFFSLPHNEFIEMSSVKAKKNEKKIRSIVFLNSKSKSEEKRKKIARHLAGLVGGFMKLSGP